MSGAKGAPLWRGGTRNENYRRCQCVCLSNPGRVGRRPIDTHPNPILSKVCCAAELSAAHGTARSMAHRGGPAYIEGRGARASPGQPSLDRGGGTDKSRRKRPGTSTTSGRRRGTTGDCDGNTTRDLGPDETDGIQLTGDRGAESARRAGQTRRESKSCSRSDGSGKAGQRFTRARPRFALTRPGPSYRLLRKAYRPQSDLCAR